MAEGSVKSAAGPGFPLSTPAVVGILVALAVPLFFVKLGAAALVDPDEPYYAVPALEMLKTGTWAVPIFRGQPWFDKPILFYWMILAAFKAFGVSEWAARVGSALAGLAGALAMATAAPAGWRRGGSHLLAAIVLATSLEYAFLSRSAVTDMTLTLFLTSGFLAVARYLESRTMGAAIAAGAAFGLATLTKGPVGVILPAAALGMYGFATRRRELLAPAPLAAGAVGFAATAVPWYAYMIAAHRDLVVQVFLGEENLGRFVSPEHRQMPLFYVVVLVVGLLPWSAALPAGLLRAVRATVRGDERSPAPTGVVFALAWFVAVVGVFSLSASKLLTYILPAFPAAAFLIAAYWTEGVPRRRGTIAVGLTGAAVAATVAAAIVTLARGDRFVEAGPSIYVLAAVLVVGGLGSVAVLRWGRLAAFAAMQAASTVGVVLVFVLYTWPGLEARESTKTLVRRLDAGGLAGDVAGAYRVPDISLDFYLDRTIARESDGARLAARVADQPGRLWVVRADDVDDLRASLPLAVEPVMTVSRRSVVRLTPEARGEPAKDPS
jgi:4-amino-4-deoxy-L-arabinose transferase-like glycosyltransferase